MPTAMPCGLIAVPPTKGLQGGQNKYILAHKGIFLLNIEALNVQGLNLEDRITLPTTSIS